jgi:hypothetical protein
MKRLVLSLAVAGLLAQVAVAQEPTPAEPPVAVAAPAPALAVEQAPTAETWMRDQQRRDAADPALAVRKNAAFRGQQRRERMESRKWYGQSLGRPVANTTPFTGTYAPDPLWLDFSSTETPATSAAPKTASMLRPLIR